MSTALIVIIVVAVVVLGLLVWAASRRAHTKEIGEAQVEAQHDDLSHHRDQAREARGEAELAEERARRAAAEAELNERKASEREQEIESNS
jgi:FtsZ-interacting cell division protein ZipA